MDNQNKDGDPESAEFYGIKMSDLFMAMADWKPTPDVSHIDPRNIGSTLSILNKTGRGTGFETVRSRWVLPENIKQLSSCRYRRKDYLRETFLASVPAPITTEGSPHEGQLTACLFSTADGKVKHAA
ncbi:hypothetical protein AMECASPLE_022038 [Ameca splendens]|uniref:Uncharacterized protein n=1 Tax=Ameca splendens TaxID=208324 RepID=A0ABV1ABQ0_9TELE